MPCNQLGTSSADEAAASNVPEAESAKEDGLSLLASSCMSELSHEGTLPLSSSGVMRFNQSGESESEEETAGAN